MACFGCRPTSFRSISRAMAKAASSRLRQMGLQETAPNWAARAAVCERCPMCVVHKGVSYCGKPFVQLVVRDPAADGCGCPTREKAKSPEEHCPVNRSFSAATLAEGRCDCRWCAQR